jgi:hypothetical protein
MRIRVIHAPTQPSIDGIRLDQFEPGMQYEVGYLLGALMLAEGWAEPVASDEPAVLAPFRDVPTTAPRHPVNLIREIFPTYYDAPPALAADRRRHPRRRRT